MVAGERQLSACPQGSQSPRGGEDPFSEEAADVLSTVEPIRNGRHREPGISSEHFEECANVGPLPGADETLHELALTGFAEVTQSRLLGLRWDALLDGLPGTLQRAVHGNDRRVELLRNLVRRKTLTSPRSARALRRREVLQSRHERKLDALQCLVNGLWIVG